MRVLCEFTPAGPSFVRGGWGRVFAACGHQFSWWNPREEPAFDAFSRAKPDLFLGTTYGVDRAVYKNIQTRPAMKVLLFASAWGNLVDNLDRQKYPIVYAAEQEKQTIAQLKRETGKPDYVFLHTPESCLEGVLGHWQSIGVEPKSLLNAADLYAYLHGKPRKELQCDVGYCGGIWPFKGRNINTYFLPLTSPASGVGVKVFGNTSWPCWQYLGPLAQEDERDLYASAKVCPSVSEPHSTDLPFIGDVVERPYKVCLSGAVCVSDYVEAAGEVFGGALPMGKSPKEYRDLVLHYVNSPAERMQASARLRGVVLERHCYHDRVAGMLGWLGLSHEGEKVMAEKKRILSRTTSPGGES